MTARYRLDTNIVSEAVKLRPSQALQWAHLMADGTAAGQPRSARDMIVAATAVVHGLTVATANERHFRTTGIPWINPLSMAD